MVWGVKPSAPVLNLSHPLVADLFWALPIAEGAGADCHEKTKNIVGLRAMFPEMENQAPGWSWVSTAFGPAIRINMNNPSTAGQWQQPSTYNVDTFYDGSSRNVLTIELIIAMHTDAASGGQMYVDGVGNVGFSRSSVDGRNDFDCAGVTLTHDWGSWTLGEFMMIHAVKRAGVMYLYKNGVEAATTQANTGSYSGGTANIAAGGGGAFGADNQFVLLAWHMWAKDLSGGSEIADRYADPWAIYSEPRGANPIARIFGGTHAEQIVGRRGVKVTPVSDVPSRSIYFETDPATFPVGEIPGLASSMGVGVPGFDGEPGEESFPIPGPPGPQGPQGAPGSGSGQIGPPGFDGEPAEYAFPIPGPAGPQGAAGGGITVEEVDGSPSVSNVTKIRVSNGGLTDDGSGQVTVNTGGGSGATGQDFIDAVWHKKFWSDASLLPATERVAASLATPPGGSTVAGGSWGTTTPGAGIPGANTLVYWDLGAARSTMLGVCAWRCAGGTNDMAIMFSSGAPSDINPDGYMFQWDGTGFKLFKHASGTYTQLGGATSSITPSVPDGFGIAFYYDDASNTLSGFIRTAGTWLRVLTTTDASYTTLRYFCLRTTAATAPHVMLPIVAYSN